MAYPTICIVGRPNVGKSSLLNMLAKRLVSIVDPTAGVTRDRVSAIIELPPPPEVSPSHADDARARRITSPKARYVEVIDTGGYGIVDAQDLSAEVERQIQTGLADADLVLFVVDAQTGIVALDQQVAEILRKARGKGKNAKPVLLVVNKVDAQAQEPHAWEAAALGFGQPVMISANTGHHRAEFLDAVYRAMDWDAAERRGAASDKAPQDGIKLALVGKRNAGKSTLINALAGNERVIVSEKAGTTRDAVDVRLEVDLAGQPTVFTAIDTAGVRKGKSLDGDIEFYSHHRTLRAVRRADVCLLLIDAAVPVSQVDRKLVQEIMRHYVPTVIVVNKWDLAETQSTQEQYAQYLDDALKGLSFAPIVFISAKEKDGLPEALAMAANLHEQANHRVGTGELNRVVETIMTERGPSNKLGKRARIYYATQVAVQPPTVAIFVNHPEIFDAGYERYFVNRLRDELPFAEVPIKLLVRGKQGMPQAGEG